MKKFMTTLTTSLKLCILAISVLAASLWPLGTAHAYELGDNLGKFYPGSLSTNSGADSWTKTASYTWSNISTRRDFWNPVITGENSTTLQRGDYLLLKYSTWQPKSDFPDKCLTSNGNWEVLDCQKEYQIVSEQILLESWLTNCNWGTEIQVCRSLVDYTDSPNQKYNITTFSYLLRWAGERQSVNQVALSGTISNKNGESNTLTMVRIEIGEFFDKGTTLQDIYDFLEENNTSEQIQQNRQEGQQAQQDANTNGSSSSQSATTDGQSLLQAFQSFLGALTNASPGNCNINMDTGFIDFGVVNLCSISPPPAFQAISSIVVIGFAIPLSLACARKIIDLFRSFQS